MAENEGRNTEFDDWNLEDLPGYEEVPQTVEPLLSPSTRIVMWSALLALTVTFGDDAIGAIADTVSKYTQENPVEQVVDAEPKKVVNNN